MQKSPKPSVPQEVYKSSVLLYTIVDYYWISPKNKKLVSILKSGWFPIKVYNYNHPIMKEKLKKLHEEQERSLKNKEIKWGRLNRMYMTI